MALEPCIIFLVDELPNFIIWQVNSKIEVTKKAFVIVVALFLSIVNRKVIERIIVDLTNMFNPLIDRVLPTLQMSVDESKRGVFIVEPDCHRPLISGHTGEPCFDLDLSQALTIVEDKLDRWLQNLTSLLPNYLEARSDAVIAIRKAFNAHDITIPFPIRTLDFGIKGGETLKEQIAPSNS